MKTPDNIFVEGAGSRNVNMYVSKMILVEIGTSKYRYYKRQMQKNENFS